MDRSNLGDHTSKKDGDLVEENINLLRPSVIQ